MKRRAVFIIALIVIAGMGYLFLSGSNAKKDVAQVPLERYAAAEGKVEISPGRGGTQQ